MINSPKTMIIINYWIIEQNKYAINEIMSGLKTWKLYQK